MASTGRRSHRRHRVPDDADARCEFVHPFPGGHNLSFPIKDISSAGISFRLERPFGAVESGDSIDRATLRIEGWEIRGDLVVMHVTEEDEGGFVCGVLFYPRGEQNLLRLKALVAELEDAEEGTPLEFAASDDEHL